MRHKDIHRSIGFIIILLSLFNLASSDIQAQEFDTLQPQIRTDLPQKGFSIEGIPTQVSIATGMIFQNNYAGKTAFSQFINPSVSFQPAQRLSIQTSFGYLQGFNQNTFLYNKESNQLEVGQQDIALGVVSVSGSYLVHPDLILSGTVWKQFSMRPQANKLNPKR